MDLFEKLARQETDFLKQEFLCPALENCPICVRIAGINLNLKPNRKYSGWGVFRPKSYKEAVFVRKASISERQEYLNLFPTIRFILCHQDKKMWHGLSLHSDQRFNISGLVPLFLVDEAQIFDVVQVRFDGLSFWYDCHYEKHNLKILNYLRESLQQGLLPKDLKMSGLTQAEKDAYNLVFMSSEEAKKTLDENRIKEALSRTSAIYRGHIERENTYTVEFVVDGQNYRSVIEKENFTIQSAGICLSGGDRAFDLQSLVGVIREGSDRIVRW